MMEGVVGLNTPFYFPNLIVLTKRQISLDFIALASSYRAHTNLSKTVIRQGAHTQFWSLFNRENQMKSFF